MHVRSEILQHRLPITHGLDVHDELALPSVRRNRVIQPTSSQWISQLGLRDAHQRAMMEQEVIGRRLPSQRVAVVIQLHSAAGHDEVNVRMIDRRIASPRVEHTEEAELASAQTLGRLAHIADGCGSGIEQRVIARALVSAQHRTDPVRHGNRDQKMLHRQQATRLFGQPSGM